LRLSHIGWNLAGLSLPLLIAVVTVPPLIARLGNERFGLLALAWGLVGYAGALDLGIGRALTQWVARLRGEGNLSTVGPILMTANRITLIAGLVGAVLIATAALSGLGSWVKADTILPSEIQYAMLLLAIALPAQAMSSTYRGVNEAFLNFKGVSLLRVGLGVVGFGGPYLISFFTIDLAWLAATLVLSRLMALAVYRWLALSCLKANHVALVQAHYVSTIAKRLFAFGGWVALSNVVSPVLMQADRFMIGVVISAAAVTYYVLPYEVVVQSLILVSAISTVIFPTLSQLLIEKSDHWQAYFRRWLYIVAAIMLVVCVALAVLLPTVLKLWLKTELQPESILIGQILCLGVFANSIGSMYFALLHAKGRADVTAKLHVLELPLFLTALFYMLHTFGIAGAAWAWVGRMVFDAIALAWCAKAACSK
jgi:O-antigen/teichoic acid export membrane protein